MNSFKTYKNLSIVVLALVVIVSFAITNLLLNAIPANGNSLWPIICIVLNLLLVFFMFFMLFRHSQQLIEKDAAIKELVAQLNKKNEPEAKVEEVTESKDVNINELVDVVIPQSLQNMGLEQFSEKILANTAKVCELVQALFYIKDKTTGEFNVYGKYAYYSDQLPKPFIVGETLPGQVAKEKKIINISNIPESYFLVISGLGKGNPKHLLIVPIIDKDETVGVIELAAFKPFEDVHIKLFEKLSVMIGKILVKIK